MQASIIPELPALQAVLEHYDAYRRQPLRGVKVVATQHVLGSTLSLFRALEACGVDTQDFAIVAKSYSSNREALAEGRSRGYRIFGGGPMESDSLPYEEVLVENIREAGRHVFGGPQWPPAGAMRSGSSLIIDDGARMFDTLSEHHPAAFRLACGVEQTTRGIRALARQDLRIPIADVGRSRAKLDVEACFIAQSMVEQLDVEIGRLAPHAVPIRRRLLLVGYGAVGERIAEVLARRSHDVAVVDQDAERAGRALAAGFPVLTLPSALAGRHIICGASGVSWFRPDWLDLVEPGSLLVNMASSDIEFAAWTLREAGEPAPAGASRGTPWTVPYRLRGSRGPIWLAKGGFPINFTGGIDPIDPQKIQLTRALLLAGALEAVTARSPGLFALPEEVQDLIIRSAAG